jgi:sugar phosphate permease
MVCDQIFQMSGLAGIAGWRWLFIIEGIITFLIACISFWTLPNHPLDTRWLNQEERQLAHDRVNFDTVDLNEKSTVFAGLKQAVKDPRVYVFAFMQVGTVASYGGQRLTIDSICTWLPTASR